MPPYFSSPFPLPTQRIVGLLTCQTDALAQTLQTRVVHCTEATATSSTGKETNQSKKAAKLKKGSADGQTQQQQWEIELEDTVLFPEGGGQPWDEGVFVTHEGSSVPVHRVVRQGVKAVHLAASPLQPGTEVSVQVDWPRRLDLMQQHTGQHLMSGVLEQVYHIPTLGWSLQPAPQASYVELPRAPSLNEMQGAMDLCNKLIRDNCPISVSVALDTDQDSRPSQIPSDYEGGVVRHVHIHSDQIPEDKNPCCGTHPPSLSHLQALHILPQTTPIRGTNVRLYFLVGDRILKNLASAMESTRLTALAHGCHQDDAVRRTEGALVTLKDSLKKEKRLREELAEHLVRELMDQAKANGGKAVLVREEYELEALSYLSGRLNTLAPADQTCVLASNTATGSCPIIVSGQEAGAVAEKLKQAFEGRLKGGGKGRWQGKLEGKINKKDAALMKEVVLQI